MIYWAYKPTYTYTCRLEYTSLSPHHYSSTVATTLYCCTATHELSHQFLLLEHGLLDLYDFQVVRSDGIGPAVENRPLPPRGRGELEGRQRVVERDDVRLSREALDAHVGVRRHRLLGDNGWRHILQVEAGGSSQNSRVLSYPPFLCKLSELVCWSVLLLTLLARCTAVGWTAVPQSIYRPPPSD